mmetsp:Transcript_15975/g.42197  ORF Transcript_15975/g.42197 Transcript_15975/m.42197 type:complete len:108 (-) Transcript_15975:265-588(-)
MVMWDALDLSAIWAVVYGAHVQDDQQAEFGGIGLVLLFVQVFKMQDVRPAGQGHPSYADAKDGQKRTKEIAAGVVDRTSWTRSRSASRCETSSLPPASRSRTWTSSF